MSSSDFDEPMVAYPVAEKITGLKLPTLYSMVSRKQIPHYRLGKRLVMFDREELIEWLRTRHVGVSK